MLFQPVGRTNKDHTLLAHCFFDVGIDGFAIELRFHAGEKFAFLLRDAEAFKRPLYIFGNFVP